MGKIIKSVSYFIILIREVRGSCQYSKVRWILLIKIIPVFLLIAPPEVSSEPRVTLQPAILIFCKICRFLSPSSIQ